MQHASSHDQMFDAASFLHLLQRGVGTTRFSASARPSRASSSSSAALVALRAFSSQARDPRAADVVAAYLALSPAAAELFSALWLAAQRPAAAAAALDCLREVAVYAKGGRGGPGEERARSVVKDVVKGRAAALFEALTAGAGGGLVARGVLELLKVVVESHPLLAKEAVNRFDLGGKAIARALCSAKAPVTRPAFTRLVTALLNSGDHDVVWALATRMRPAVSACLDAYRGGEDGVISGGGGRRGKRKEEEGGAEGGEEGGMARDPPAVEALLLALEERVLPCPNPSVARSAFEPPVLQTLADMSISGSPHASAASHLFHKAVAASAAASGPIVPTAHVARVLASVPVSASRAALEFVLRAVAACPRAARMLLQIAPFVSATPRLSSAWLASAAVLSRCVRELRTPTPAFARARFFEKCWASESEIVRHYGLLVAAALCEVVLAHPFGDRVAHVYLPAPACVDAVLRKAGERDAVAHAVYGHYRTLFRREFEENKADAIRIAMDAGYGRSPGALAGVVRACLVHGTNAALATVFHRHLFSALLEEGTPSNFHLLSQILLATRLFPAGTELETDVWLTTAKRVAAGSAMKEFEIFIVQAWEKPYALFDDFSGSSSALPRDAEAPTALPLSLLAAAALRRLDKLGKDVVTEHGSLRHVLQASVRTIVRLCCPYRGAAVVEERIGSMTLGLPTGNNDGQLVSAAAPLMGDCADANDPLAVDIAVCDVQEYFLRSRERKVAADAVLRVARKHLLGALPASQVMPHRVATLLYVLENMSMDVPGGPAEALALEACRWLATAETEAEAEGMLVPRVVFNAGLLRSSPTCAVRSEALTYLCRVLGSSSRKKISSSVTGYVHEAAERCLRPQTGLLSVDLEKEDVVSIIAALGSKTGCKDTVLAVTILLGLVLHGDAVVRSTAKLQIADALSRNALSLKFGKVQLSQATALSQLIRHFPLLAPELVSFCTESSLTSVLIAHLAPALATSLEIMSDISGDAVSQLASSVVPALFADTGAEIDLGDSYDAISQAVFMLVRRLCGASLSREHFAICAAFLSRIGERRNLISSSLAVVAVRALYERCLSGTNINERLALVDFMAAVPVAFLHGERGSLLASSMLTAASSQGLFAGLDMQRIEALEQNVGLIVVDISQRARECVTVLECISRFLKLDLMLDSPACEVLAVLARTLESDVGPKVTNPFWISALGGAISSAIARLPRLGFSKAVADSLASLEGFLSEHGGYRASPSACDQSTHGAMCDIATALKGSQARKKYLLPEKRSGLFSVDAADVVGMLGPDRIAATAGAIICENVAAPEENLYEASFIFTVLRQAACEALDRPTVAVLDLGVVVRSGLVGAAIAGLASKEERIRVLAYAALAMLTKAVGPEAGVSRDAASALYRDRRQLAFFLNLLRSSVRAPLEQVIPLCATFFRLALGVVLRPTHGAYREVTRILLRTPAHNVHDADGASCLLREDGDNPRRLGIEILERGLRTPADHHVARRRNMYDSLLLLGSKFPYEVLSAFKAIVEQGNKQISADLVRAYGILPWLMGNSFGEDGCIEQRLSLLACLAKALPEGVLRPRHAPGFALALENLAMSSEASPTAVARASLEVARLTPYSYRLFDLPARHRGESLAVTVYSTSSKSVKPTASIVEGAIMACCPAEQSEKPTFPSTDEEFVALQAFFAERILADAALRNSQRIRHALASLMLDAQQQLSTWSFIAVLAAVPVAEWTPEVHTFADRVPCGVGPNGFQEVDFGKEGVVMRGKLARLLVPDSADGHASSGGESKRKKGKMDRLG